MSLFYLLFNLRNLFYLISKRKHKSDSVFYNFSVMFLHTGFLKEKPERNLFGFSPVAFVAYNIFTGAIWLYNKSMAQGIN